MAKIKAKDRVTVSEQIKVDIEYTSVKDIIHNLVVAERELISKGCYPETISSELTKEYGYYDDSWQTFVLRGSREETDQEYYIRTETQKANKIEALARLKEQVARLEKEL